MEHNYTVYKPTSGDGRVYIGMTHQTLNKRCRKGGYQENSVIGQAIKEFGWDTFKVSIIAEHLSKSEAECLEMKNIANYNSTDPTKGFNVALGGNIQGRHSLVTRKKMSDGQKGRKLSKSHIQKLHKPKLNGALRRKVLQYDLNGNFLREYNSLCEAAEAVSACKNSIGLCCNHHQHTSVGYKWEWGKRGDSND